MKKAQLLNHYSSERKQNDLEDVTIGMNQESALDISNLNQAKKGGLQSKYATKVKDNYKKLIMPAIKSITNIDNPKKISNEGLNDQMTIEEENEFNLEQMVYNNDSVSSGDSIISFQQSYMKKSETLR